VLCELQGSWKKGRNETERGMVMVNSRVINFRSVPNEENSLLEEQRGFTYLIAKTFLGNTVTMSTQGHASGVLL
jgi:hypothetical protein